MRLTQILQYTAFAGMAAMLWGCDDVKPDDRYIFSGDVAEERTVLLEDFTGQKCLNCPQAHEEIQNLEKEYGDKLVAVSIHCGEFGLSKTKTNFSNGTVGLMTEEGNAILETYGIVSFPMGVIDFNLPPKIYSLWQTEVRNAIQVPTDVDIDMKVEYTPSTTDPNTGTVNISADVLSGTTRSAKIQFWVIEDGIVAAQKNGNQTIKDYVHNGVFRVQILPGQRGETIALAKGIDFIKDASIETRWNEQEHWVPENLSIVAFVSEGNSMLQVAKVPVIAKETPDDTEGDGEEQTEE